MRDGASLRRTFAALLIGMSVVACGSDEPGASTPESRSDATTTDATVATDAAPAETRPGGTLPARDVDDVSFTDPTVTGPAEAVCAAYGRLAEEGGKALTGILAPEAVVVDAVSGDQYTGADEIAGHAGDLVDAGLESAGCIHLVQSDHWVAETIVLHYDDLDVRQGILAVHVTDDGRVDRVVHHLSERSDVPGERVDPGTGVLAVAAAVCEAWAADDVDGMLALLTPEPAVHTRREFVGADAVRQFAETLPYDVHTCGVPIQNGEWEAIESIMTDPAAGVERSMLAVLRLEGTAPEPVLATDIWFHFDA